MTVVAFDGSKYNLPATAPLREAFDPGSGLQNPGRGHYPECLVSTAYDVLRRIPLARTTAGFRGSERDEAVKMLDKITPHGVLLYDRGYPSFGLIKVLVENYSGFFSMRCKSTKTFPAVQDFLASGQQDSDLWIKPTQNYLNALPPGRRSGQSPIKLRAIRLIAPDGTISVLLTNMLDREEFPTNEIIKESTPKGRGIVDAPQRGASEIVLDGVTRITFPGHPGFSNVVSSLNVRKTSMELAVIASAAKQSCLYKLPLLYYKLDCFVEDSSQ